MGPLAHPCGHAGGSLLSKTRALETDRFVFFRSVARGEVGYDITSWIVCRQRRPPHDELIRDFGLAKATALNMSNMIGIGPFITMNLILGAMGGPQAILGWIVGVLLAICDGMVWSELSAAMPGSGGTTCICANASAASAGDGSWPSCSFGNSCSADRWRSPAARIGLSKYAAYPLVHYGWIDAEATAGNCGRDRERGRAKRRRSVRQLVDEQARRRTGDRLWRVGLWPSFSCIDGSRPSAG